MSTSELRRRQRPVEDRFAKSVDEINHLLESQKPKKVILEGLFSTINSNKFLNILFFRKCLDLLNGF
jgi:Holliday junction resolvasome RuvABC endonuclease subunit